LLKFTFIFLLGTGSYYSHAQDSAALQVSRATIDSLEAIYGRDKKPLPAYEAQTLLALSFYPELANENIRFKYAHLNGTAQTTVSFLSIFRRANKRYIILINDDAKATGLVLSDAPFDAQVAVLGHEFAHVLDFKPRGFLGMIWWGLNYLVGRRRTRIENETDRSTIRHGLGWALYHWSDFVLNHSTANEHYKRIRQTKYMHPAEIADYIKKIGLK
jgi:hypothetical protein